MGDNIHDEIVEFTIKVVDQNDNKPVFTQDPFIGSVSDASKIGSLDQSVQSFDKANTVIIYSSLYKDSHSSLPSYYRISVYDHQCHRCR